MSLPTTRTTWTILGIAVVGLLAGCTGRPAGNPTDATGGGDIRTRPELFSESRSGAYPPPPGVRRMPIRWLSGVGDTGPSRRLVDREKYGASPVGRISLDLDGSRMAYVLATAVGGNRNDVQPNALVLRNLGGRPRILGRTGQGRIFESVRLSYPWIAWVERDSERVWDWTIRARDLAGERDIMVAKRDGRLGVRQFPPSISLDGGLLVWDQRVSKAGRSSNVVAAFELARRRKVVVDESGLGHSPCVSGRRIWFNEEIVRRRGDKVGVKSDIYSVEPLGARRRVTGTGFAMFAEARGNTLAWLDMRRYWLHQPAIADAYYRRRGGGPRRITTSGLAERVLAGDDLIAWQETPGRVSAVDVRTRRGYRLTGASGREGLLFDVDGRRVAFELQPDPWRGERTNYELVIVELDRGRRSTRKG